MISRPAGVRTRPASINCSPAAAHIATARSAGPRLVGRTRITELMFVMLFGNQAANDVTTTPPHI
jgi:hypothetical protein